MLKKEDKGMEIISLINRLGEVSHALDLREDNRQCHPSQFTNTSYLQELQERDITIQRILSELVLDSSTAQYVLDWLTSQLDSSASQTLTRLGWTELQAATVLRLLQYITCTARPIFTYPHFSFAPWAGKTLQKLYRIEKPASESWPFFSDLKGVGPAQICDTAIAIRGNRLLEPITLRDLVRRVPAVLGPAGIDPQNHQQKYFFVKFLDPSDFPPFAYAGFRPEIVHGLENFQTYFADLLWKDRQSLEALYHLVAPQIQSESTLRLFEAAYKTWAIAQASRDWNGELSIDTLSSFVSLSRISELKALLTEQQKNRQQVVRCMHRIDYQEGQAILIPSPTLHAIAGLSGQFHPNTAENYHPKDELWIFKTIYDTEGQKLGWILVEPQRLFDKTESGFDFFTPFSWTEKGFGFRKAISQESLTDFVHLMDARPRPREAYLCFAEAMTPPGGTTSEGAQWYAIVDDERIWPFFLVHELRFERSGGTATVPFTSHSFSEVHVTQGVVEMTLGYAEGPPLSFTITPARPVFLPASLPCNTVTYTATGAAQLQVFRRP